MHYCIITSGPVSNLAASRVREDHTVFCADGGADFCLKNNIIPDKAFGDMDSISAEGLAFLKENKIEPEVFPVEKDWTDTEICLRNIPEGSDILIICPINSGRIDHVIANIQLAISFKPYMKSIVITDGITDIYPMNGKTDLAFNVTDLADPVISLVPMDFDIPVTDIRSEGLYYPYNGEDYSAGKSITFSNHPAEGADTVKISIRSGHLAVIVTRSV